MIFCIFLEFPSGVLQRWIDMLGSDVAFSMDFVLHNCHIFCY